MGEQWEKPKARSAVKPAVAQEQGACARLMPRNWGAKRLRETRNIDQRLHIRGVDEKGPGRVESRKRILSLGDEIFPRNKESFPEVRRIFSGDDAKSGLGRKQGLEDGMVSD